MESDFPDAAEVIKNDVYVEDCISGKGDWNKAMSVIDEMKLVLACGARGLRFLYMILLNDYLMMEIQSK